MTLDITPVDDAPTSANSSVSVTEDTTYTFAASNFGFSDPDTGDSLGSVVIATLPSNGTIKLDGVAISANDVISKADIDANKLTYVPVANDDTDESFTFKVRDADGTASSNTATMTLDLQAVNDAPTASNNTVTATEDNSYVFSASEFNFTDVDTGAALSQIQITTL